MEAIEKRIWVENTFFSGIKPRKACRVRASFGTVSGYLCDETGNRTRDYEFPVFLAKTDRVPLIVGFAGLLEKLHTDFDYETKKAWIKEKDDITS